MIHGCNCGRDIECDPDERETTWMGMIADLQKSLKELTAERDELRKALKKTVAALEKIPICNNEYIYEAFCDLPKGHAERCGGISWNIAAMLAGQEALHKREENK